MFDLKTRTDQFGYMTVGTYRDRREAIKEARLLAGDGTDVLVLDIRTDEVIYQRDGLRDF